MSRAELLNGRVAMLGFVIGVLTEAITGHGIVSQLSLSASGIELMTDYSIWIYAMLAFGGAITAAVYTLSKPTDLPYLNRDQ